MLAPHGSSNLWQQMLPHIRDRIAPQNFRIWLAPIRRARMEDDRLVVEVPNVHRLSGMRSTYRSPIGEAARIVVGRDVKIDFEVNSAEEVAPGWEEPEFAGGEARAAGPVEGGSPVSGRSGEPDSWAEEMDQLETGSRPYPGLDSSFSFDSFVVGPSNQMAHASCVAVADNPGKAYYNPLFIYGGSGLGKTHLLHAIGLTVSQQYPQMRVIYVSADRFMNEVIRSLGAGRPKEFRERYRDKCDILLMDDLQFLAGKPGTQDEFFHTFNHLHGAGKQIVVTSDRYANEIPDLEERLRSRMQGGLVADIQTPQLETKVAILNSKAEREGIRLPSDVALYLASSVRSNVRELQGCLNRLNAYRQMCGQDLSLEMARNALRNILPEQRQRTSVDSIMKLVAEHYEVKISEIKSKRRHRRVLVPRQVAMFLGRKIAGASFPELGKAFGNRDHSTVINACQKIERLMKADSGLRREISALEGSLVA